MSQIVVLQGKNNGVSVRKPDFDPVLYDFKVSKTS